jgi:hypothetical protein
MVGPLPGKEITEMWLAFLLSILAPVVLTHLIQPPKHLWPVFAFVVVRPSTCCVQVQAVEVGDVAWFDLSLQQRQQSAAFWRVAACFDAACICSDASSIRHDRGQAGLSWQCAHLLNACRFCTHQFQEVLRSVGPELGVAAPEAHVAGKKLQPWQAPVQVDERLSHVYPQPDAQLMACRQAPAGTCCAAAIRAMARLNVRVCPFGA